MKKNHSLYGEADSYAPLKKIIRKMKITLFVVLLSAIQIFANGVYSQNTRFSLQKKNATIETVLGAIEDQSEYYFLYNGKLVDVMQKIDLSVENQTIENTLNELLRNTDIAFKVFDRQIVLSPKESVGGNQQQNSISGQVSDTSGGSLPGVSVVVKGTTTGTITDADGNYSLANVPANATIVFSFVGLKPQEIKVDGKSKINVTLVEETIGLDEVVAVGYGTQSKRAVTGSIQSVGSDALSDMPVTTVAQKLQGKLSGVQINQTTGKPGQGMQVRIRGQASLTAGNDPLYVVDGFPLDGDISSINPNEIESISVLKDASSTALYGSRAANGVIMVTTKRAKQGKTSIDVAANYGLQSVPERGRPKMMDGTEFAQFKKESYEDLGLPVPSVFQNPSQYGKGYDYFDAILRTATIQDYSVSLSAGKDNFSTNAVVGLFNQEGVILNSTYQRFSLRLNNEFKITDKIKAGFNVAPTYTKDNTPSTDGQFWAGGIVTNSLLVWPIVPYINPDGTMPYNSWVPGVGTFPTPNYYRATQEISNKTDQTRILATGYLQYEPIKGLILKSAMNADLRNVKFKNTNPSTTSTGFAGVLPALASAIFRSDNTFTWLNENTATYKKSIGNHNFEALAGFSMQRFRFDRMQVNIQGYPDDRISTIGAAATINRSGTTNTYNDIQEWSMMSYLGRVNYNYKNRYLVSAAIRSDGSSRFGADQRWGTFPSASIGWIASEENFMKGISAISLLKIRASYGIVGNNNIGNYTQYAAVSSGNSSYNAMYGTTLGSGSAVTQLPNSNLTWEQTAEYDFGFDLGLFKNRLNIGYDFYNRNSKSLLYSVAVAQESGFTSFNGNIGELQFWGHEIAINSQNLVGKLKWTTDFNISFTDNKVKALFGNVNRIYGDGTITKVGQRIGLFYGMVHDGVYDNKAEYDASPKAVQSQVGTSKFKDVGGGVNGAPDGRITNGGDNDDRSVIGDPTPEFTFGITNNFNYKSFDLSIVMSGSYGNDIANMGEQGLTNLDGVFNVLAEVKDRWRSEANPGAGKYGKTTAGTANERDWFSTRFLSDASYLTVKNVSLGYTFSKIKIKNIKNLRVYVSAQQLYTFTKYKGMNPEISMTNTGASASALNLGHDYGGYPVPRTISFGLNLGL
jgi:TonB-linked SusC/RagA family outer membrane protein